MGDIEGSSGYRPRHAAPRRAPSADRLAWVCFALLIAAAAFLCFYRLGDGVVWNADESRHAINAYEMLDRGDMLVSTYNGEVDYWNLKPPLANWAIVASYLVFGFNAFALRAPSALAYLLTLVIVFLFARRRFGAASAAATLVFALACTYVWGLHFARSGNADALYVLFFTGSMLCLMRAEESHRWIYPCGLCVALAFLTKASHALLLFPLILLCLLATRTLLLYRAREAAGFFACACIPVIIWGAARFLADGTDFFEAMIGVDTVGRIAEANDGNTASPIMYLQVLRADRSLLACVGIIAAVALVRMLLALGARMRGKGSGAASLHGQAGAIGAMTAPFDADAARLRRHGLICLGLWAALPLIVFSLMTTKLVWYVYASFIPLFMLGGIGAAWLARVLRGWRRAGMPSALCAAAALIVCAACIATGAYHTLRIVVGGEFIGLWGHDSVQAVCGDGMLQPELIRAWEDGELPQDAVLYIDYGDSTTLDPSIDGKGLRQGTFAVAEWYGHARCSDGGIPGFLADDGRAVLFVTDAVYEGHRGELEGARLVCQADGYRVLTHGS